MSFGGGLGSNCIMLNLGKTGEIMIKHFILSLEQSFIRMIVQRMQIQVRMVTFINVLVIQICSGVRLRGYLEC